MLAPRDTATRERKSLGGLAYGQYTPVTAPVARDGLVRWSR